MQAQEETKTTPEAETTTTTTGGGRGAGRGRGRGGRGRGQSRDNVQSDNTQQSGEGHTGESERGGRGRGRGRGGANAQPRKDNPAFLALIERDEKDKKELDVYEDKILKIRAQMDKIDTEIKTLTNKRTSEREKLKSFSEKSKEDSSERKTLIENREELNKKKKQLTDERKKYFDSLDSLKKQLPFQNEKDKDFVRKNYNEVNNQIEKLEAELRSGKVGLKDEKKLITDIATLSKKKALVKEFEKGYNVYLSQGPPIDRLSEEINQLNTKIDASFSNNKETQPQWDVIKKGLEKLDTSINQLFEKKNKLYEELKAAIEAKKVKATSLRDASTKRWDAFKVDQEKKKQEKAAKQKADYEARQKLRQQREEERKKRQEEKELSELSKIPYDEEVTLCDQLVVYLEGLNPTKGKKKPVKNLSHPLEVYCSFEVLSLAPPSGLTEIEASVVDIKKRKEEFLSLQAQKIKEREEQKKILEEQRAKEEAEKAEREKAEKEKAEAEKEKAEAEKPAETSQSETEAKPAEGEAQTSEKPAEEAKTQPETSSETPAEQPTEPSN